MKIVDYIVIQPSKNDKSLNNEIIDHWKEMTIFVEL